MHLIMRTLFVLLVVISSIFLGCATIPYKYQYTQYPSQGTITKRHIPVYVDKEFSSEDKLSIDRSIEQWNYALNQHIILTVVTYQFDMEPEVILEARKKNGFLILKVDSNNSTVPDSMPLEQCRVSPICIYTLAWTDSIGGNVMKVVRDRISTTDVEHIVLHELGHLLSAEHIDDINSLMYPKYNKISYLCIDYTTVKQVALHYFINPKTMNHCILKY